MKARKEDYIEKIEFVPIEDTLSYAYRLKKSNENYVEKIEFVPIEDLRIIDQNKILLASFVTMVTLTIMVGYITGLYLLISII